MKPNRQRILFLITTIFMVIFSLLNPMIAFADDNTPPSPTEEPAQPPMEESSALEVPVQGDVNESGILSQVPQETEVVVINESGEIEPLVSQNAVDIILSGDPIWCKDNVSPDPLDVANCTSSYTSLQDLLDYLALNQPTANGTIWIEDTYDSSINDAGITAFTLDGATLATWASYALTIQGGWDGNSGSIVVDSLNPSLFNGASLSIINWGNTVTVNDIIVDGAPGDGLTVTTTGDIVLHNIQAKNNTNQGARLDNTNGSGTISLTGKNIFKNNSNFGLRLSSCGIVTINNLSANNNGSGASIVNGCSSNAGLEGIQMSGRNSFSGNDSFGLYVQSKGNISLQNISANDNGFFGAVLDTCIWGPNTQGCAGVGNIVLGGENSFNDNAGGVLAGLNILSGGKAALYNVTASGNSGDGIYLEILLPSSIKFSCIKNNRGYGIMSYGGDLTLNGVTFFENLQGDVRILSGSFISIPGADNCVYENKKEAEYSRLLIHYVETTSGQTIELDCELFSGTMLILPDDNSAYFPCPLSDSASLMSNTQNELPGSLPNGTTFGSALTTSVTKNGESQNTVEDFITISFKIPEDAAVSGLTILYWDGTQWVELTDGLTLQDGRYVALGGFVSADGLSFNATVNFTGTFVLVQK